MLKATCKACPSYDMLTPMCEELQNTPLNDVRPKWHQDMRAWRQSEGITGLYRDDPAGEQFPEMEALLELCFNYLTFYPVSAMPDLDYCVADTRKNITTCATRTQLARMTAVGANDTVQLQNGTKMAVGTLNIAAYKSNECQLHDAVDVTAKRKPNTKAAVSSIIVVPLVLLSIGFFLYTKYSKQEEMEALLAKAREQGLDAALAEIPE